MTQSYAGTGETTDRHQTRSFRRAPEKLSPKIPKNPSPQTSEKLSPQIKTALEKSQAQYRKVTQSLLSDMPDAEALYRHLIFLRKSRDSFQTQYDKIKNDREKEQSIQEVLASIDEAIAMVSKHMMTQLAQMDIHGGAAYAYGPREGVHYDVHTPGRDHFQLALPLVHGRLVRQMGDLMCKTSKEFWGLRITDDPFRITCWACLKRMLKILESQPKKKGKQHKTN